MSGIIVVNGRIFRDTSSVSGLVVINGQVFKQVAAAAGGTVGPLVNGAMTDTLVNGGLVS